MPNTNVDVAYGIASILFGDKPADGQFPAVGATTDVRKVTHIVMDSFTQTKDDDQEEDVNCEDLDDVFLVLDGEKGKTTITFRSYNYSKETYNAFLGFEEQADGSLIKIPNYVIPEQYMEVKTRQIQNYPAKYYQYMPVKVKVAETGNLGKSGLRELEFTVTLLANVVDGVEKGNQRILDVSNPETEG